MRLRIFRSCFRVRGVYQTLGYVMMFFFMFATLLWRDTMSDCTVFNLQGTLFFRPRPKFFCFRFSGDLGDQMFQYAFLLTVRIRYSTEIILLPDNILVPVFDIVPQNEFVAHYCECFPKRSQKETVFEFDQSLLNVDMNFNGKYRNSKYFQSQVEEVRSRFRLKKRITIEAREDLEKLKSRSLLVYKNITLIGIYLGKLIEEINPVKIAHFIDTAVDFYRKMNNDVHFVAVINRYHENNWRKFKFVKRKDVSVITRSAEEATLGLLANMDHSIVLPESIAWWGAWLARGKVVYYKDLSVPANKTIDKLVFPESWIGLSLDHMPSV